MSRTRIRGYHELSGTDASDLGGQVARQVERVGHRLRTVERVIAVTSGKGGVGKSLVAAGLAAGLQRRGHRVGLLDADLNGPTAVRLLGLSGARLRVQEEGAIPPETPEGVAVMSMALLLEEEAPLRWRDPGSEGFVWRGAQERGALREFLADVSWGRRDLLLVDLPPGPGRLEELWELVPGLAGAVAVTIPSAASGTSVARSLALCRSRGIPLLGVIENMATYRCADCGREGPLFAGQAGRELAERFGIPLLGGVPFDPDAAARADRGDVPGLLDTAAGRRIAEIGTELLRTMEGA